MLPIKDHLPEFTQALTTGKTVTFSKNGWRIEKGLKRIFIKICRRRQATQKIAKAFNTFLDAQERISVCISSDLGLKQQEKDKHAEILKAAKAVKNRLKVSQSRKNQQLACELKRRVISLKYRIGAELGGIDPLTEAQIDPLLKQKIAQEFLAWKNKQHIYKDKALTSQEITVCQDLCRYPKFACFMLSKPHLKEEVFKRVFRDHYGIPEFIEFYSIYRRMEECLLVGWIGRFGRSFFSIEMQPEGTSQRKVVTMLMDGKKVDLLNEEGKVVFDAYLEKTVKSVLEAFKAKNDEAGDFAVFGEGGIRRFKCHHHDKFNPATKTYELIDVSEPNSCWWKDYPIFEKVSKEELVRRYPHMINAEGIVVEAAQNLKEGMWMVIEKASTESDGLDLDASHGYLDIYIPQPNGEYLLLPFGKFAERFPKGLLGKLGFIVGTFKSKISFGDENHCYFRRQQAAVAYGAEEDKAKALMEWIRKSILVSREGNLVFQFPWENCAQWSYVGLKETFGKKKNGGVIENNYKIPILTTTPSNSILKKLVKTTKASPRRMQPAMTKIILLCFGSFRKKTIMENGVPTVKSVTKSGFRKKQHIYLPGYLHHRIKQGTVSGVLSVGPFQ